MIISLSEKQINVLRIACLVLANNFESLANQTKDAELVGIYNEHREECKFLADLLRKKRAEWWSSDFD